jgi:hypothetical protein
MKTRIMLLMFLVAALSLMPTIVWAQNPGDCDGSGVTDPDDAFYLLTYLYGGGPPPVNPADCDCDNHPGITGSDGFWLERYVFLLDNTLFPSPGTYLTEVSDTKIFTVGRTMGKAPNNTVAIWIAIPVGVRVDGFSLPFSFASESWEADLSIDSVSFVGSVIAGGASSNLDNTKEEFIIKHDPILGVSASGETVGMLATAYFSQDAPGLPTEVVLTTTDRLLPELYQQDWLGDFGAHVKSPSFEIRPPGDVTCDHQLDIDDVVAVISHIFSGGALCYW